MLLDVELVVVVVVVVVEETTGTTYPGQVGLDCGFAWQACVLKNA